MKTKLPNTPRTTFNLMTLNCCVHIPGARNVYNIALISRGITLVLTLSTTGLLLWSKYDSALSTAVRVLLHFLSIPFALIAGQPAAMLISFIIYAVKKDNFSDFKREVRLRRSSLSYEPLCPSVIEICGRVTSSGPAA
jgi:hypothetical protein